MNVLSGVAFSPLPSCFPKAFPVKIHQLDSRRGGFKPLIPKFHASPIDRLVQRIGGDDSEHNGHAGLQACLSDATRYFRGDVIEMGSLPANDRAQTNYCFEPSGFREF